MMFGFYVQRYEIISEKGLFVEINPYLCGSKSMHI